MQHGPCSNNVINMYARMYVSVFQLAIKQVISDMEERERERDRNLNLLYSLLNLTYPFQKIIT